MEPFKVALSFILGLAFVFFYYKWLWISTKIRSKELKLIAKHGKDSPIVFKFRKRYKRFYHSRLFRFGVFVLFTLLVYLIFGKPGLAGFFIALIMGNLILFPWGWVKSSKNPNGESS